MKKPNILYLHAHDAGRYIQPHGYAIATPALQQLAEEGVLFRQNFCVNPTCSASRAALLTGCYPHENGMTGLAHRGWALNDYGQHMLHALRKAGYVSALAGDQHVSASCTSRDREPWQTIGYDQYLGPNGCEGAETFFENPPEAPFFLAVGFGDTHRVFPPIEAAPDDPRYCMPPAPLPDTPETRQDMARYKAAARQLDRKMGKVLEALDRSGCADNTLVICTTDHGIAFPRMKCNLEDDGIGVFLIVRGPGGFSGGKVVDAMVGHMDIFPTVCELSRAPLPGWLRGKSLLPLVNGDAESIHDELFFEINYHAAYEPVRAVRTQRWKYIRRFSNRATPILTNTDNGESKSFWIDHGYKDQPVPKEALFDLCFDPHEKHNLIDSPAHQEVLEHLRGRLHEEMESTNDPLLKGDIPAPSGARVNSQDDISPGQEPMIMP